MDYLISLELYYLAIILFIGRAQKLASEVQGTCFRNVYTFDYANFKFDSLPCITLTRKLIAL